MLTATKLKAQYTNGYVIHVDQSNTFEARKPILLIQHWMKFRRIQGITQCIRRYQQKAANKIDGIVALAMVTLQAVQNRNTGPLIIASF